MQIEIIATSLIRQELGLIPAGGSNAVLLRAKYPKALTRGARFAEKASLVDYLQLNLDCYHLPDRGREQAREIREQLILTYE